MKAAMWDKNVWILNASSEEARVFLLGAGFINIDGTMVRLYGDHPFINLDKDGNRIPSTKLIIDGLPIDLDGDVITRHLTSLGIQTRSKLKFENAWDPETKSLTEWLTGKRFIFIDLPTQELKKSIKIGEYNMKLYYKEMEKETPRCKRCFGAHWTNTCREEERCLSCKLPGHRKGDPTCPVAIQEFEHVEEQSEDSESEDEMDDETADEREDDRYLSADDDENRDNRENRKTNEDNKDSKSETEGGKNSAGATEEKGKGNQDLDKDETTKTNRNGSGAENQNPEKIEKKKETKKITNENRNRKNSFDKQNCYMQPPQSQDRGRDQEKMYKYANSRQDRSTSKRRASKSPSSTSQESKLKRVDSNIHGRGRGNPKK